jgi:hypothetical protein
MDKQNMVHPFKGILLGHKRIEGLIYAATWISLKNIMLSEKSQL